MHPGAFAVGWGIGCTGREWLVFACSPCTLCKHSPSEIMVVFVSLCFFFRCHVLPFYTRSVHTHLHAHASSGTSGMVRGVGCIGQHSTRPQRAKKRDSHEHGERGNEAEPFLRLKYFELFQQQRVAGSLPCTRIHRKTLPHRRAVCSQNEQGYHRRCFLL